MKRFNEKIGLLFLLLLPGIPQHLFSQEASHSPFFISLDYQTGENKPHREIVKNLTYPYRAVNMKLGWQTIGKQDWQVAYRYPCFGIGMNASTFHTDILGEPVSLYFFTQFPQLSTKFFRVDLELDLGVSYGINPYHPILNPKNFSTGSSVNALFGLYLEQTFHVSPQTDFFISEGFTHYSNGALGYPNLGLNIPSLKFGVRYIHNRMAFLNKGIKSPFKYRVQLISYAGTGTKTLYASTPRYNEIVFSPSLFLQTGFKRRIGIGYELVYNEAIRGIYEKRDYSGTQLLTHALHVSHEFLIKRFTLLTQLGFYLSEPPLDKIYYERIGIGYYLSKHLRIVLNLKAHYIKAEYIEAGICFDLNFN